MNPNSIQEFRWTLFQEPSRAPLQGGESAFQEPDGRNEVTTRLHGLMVMNEKRTKNNQSGRALPVGVTAAPAW